MEMTNINKIVNLVVGLLVISSLYFGYQTYQLKKQVAIAQQGVVEIVNFINQQISNNKSK